MNFNVDQRVTIAGNPPGRVRTVRLIYFMAGIGISAWAIAVPFTKIRFGLNDATLGLILLAPGIGGILAMPLAGIGVARYGSKFVLLAAGIAFGIILPALAIAPSPAAFTLLLFLFGAAFGMIDIAMNAQAVASETRSGSLLMSSFHAQYSLGTLAVALATSLLLKLGANNAFCAALSGLAIFAILAQHKFLQPKQDDPRADGPAFAMPNRATIALGLACFACFMTEGAVTDWSSIFLRFSRGVGISAAFYGYAGFALAMAATRLAGDRAATILGKPAIMRLGSLLAAAGMLLAILTPYEATDVIGFALVGVGTGNIAPLIFSAASKIPGMSPNASVPAIMTLGYAGFLLGPVLIGLIANATSLGTSFALIAAMLAVLSLGASVVK
jgi:predicted MFS family arabinose efflux permease